MMNVRKLLPAETLTPCGHIASLGLPSEDFIELADIVFAMARINRFGGWWKSPVTVLNHTFLVYELTKVLETEASLSRRDEENAGQLLACYALLHDAHEAYLGDQTRPIEWLDRSNVRRDLKSKYDCVIFERAGLPQTPPRWITETIYRCDEWAAEIEADRCLVHGRSGWASQARSTGPAPNKWFGRQGSNRPYEEWHFFDLWMQVAPAEGKVWALAGLQRFKEVCPDLLLVGDDWLADQMAKSGGF